jgi:hypothetical protein
MELRQAQDRRTHREIVEAERERQKRVQRWPIRFVGKERAVCGGLVSCARLEKADEASVLASGTAEGKRGGGTDPFLLLRLRPVRSPMPRG